MKKLLIGLMLLAANVEAGLISRTYNYTSGNTLDSNENNTNETTIYTEFNGHIDAANIEDGSITNAELANTQIEVTKFSSTVQSSFTFLNQLSSYRRPNLVWISITSVDVEENTGTDNETCVLFPQSNLRCVTENTASTNLYRRFIITSTATFTSGTEDSGMSGPYAVNQWLFMYGVKSQIDATKFVLAATTNTPVQANYAELNNKFGTNGWVYLGAIRRGDNSADTTSILLFSQVGNSLQFGNTATGNVSKSAGIRVATTAGATSLQYDMTANFGFGNNDVPNHCGSIVRMSAFLNPSANAAMQVYDQSTSGPVLTQIGTGGTAAVAGLFIVQSTPAGSSGAPLVRQSDGGSVAMDIFVTGCQDVVLGIGLNPQL